MEDTIHISNMYMRMLSPLSDEVKLDLIHKLSASLLTKKTKTKTDNVDVFANLTGAWDDSVSPEEEMDIIRKSRRSGTTRIIDEW